MGRKQLLSAEACQQKIRRIAYQIWEENFQEKELLLAGVKNRGVQIAELIGEELRNLSGLKVEVTWVRLNKDNPVFDEITIGVNPADWQNKVVVIVDDVAHTGKTLLYAIKPFMAYTYKRLQIAVLVDRAHKSYPVHADFVGISLATTLQENIAVTLSKDGVKVYLH